MIETHKCKSCNNEFAEFEGKIFFNQQDGYRFYCNNCLKEYRDNKNKPLDENNECKCIICDKHIEKRVMTIKTEDESHKSCYGCFRTFHNIKNNISIIDKISKLLGI